VALTCGKPEDEATQWTGRAMAQAAGISLASVQRIWRAHDLKPHRVGSFKRSRDPHFADKLIDVVGLYLAPPAQAVVLSIDEKSQIQALDRTHLGLPLKSGRCATMTHDYIRHGTTTLFAALNVLDGTVIGRCMQRHRHEEFIRFLNTVEREVPDDKTIEAVVDNYATHKHPKVKVRWSGEACWIPLGELKLELAPENHTSYPAPGAIILYPGGISETEFLLAYGGVRFASKVGQLAGNHFLTITEGRENLAALGKLTLWHGAQDIAFEPAAG